MRVSRNRRQHRRIDEPAKVKNDLFFLKSFRFPPFRSYMQECVKSDCLEIRNHPLHSKNTSPYVTNRLGGHKTLLCCAQLHFFSCPLFTVSPFVFGQHIISPHNFHPIFYDLSPFPFSRSVSAPRIPFLMSSQSELPFRSFFFALVHRRKGSFFVWTGGKKGWNPYLRPSQ